MTMADTVFVNGQVVTVDKSFRMQKAIAIKDGWIIAVGENADIKPYIGYKTQVIDLAGKVILPAAHDAHMHGIWYGVSKPPVSMDFSYPHIKSIADMREQIAQKVKSTPKGQWIKAVGWQTGYLEECKIDPYRLPRKGDFDAVTPDHPIAVYDFALHTLVVNSKALEICGVTRATANPTGGEMERDTCGEPTGVFKEFEAQGIIMKHFPRLTDEELKTAIRYTQHELNKNGTTSYNESSLGPGGNLTYGGALGERAIHVYKQMQENGELSARVSVGLLMGSYGALSYDDVVSGFEVIDLPQITDENWFNIPMLKIFADGIPANYTAWTIDDYLGKPGNHGRACLPGNSDEEQKEELHKIIMLAHKKGYQVGIHTVGDRALEYSLEGFIKAMDAFPGKTPRHYVIHADMATNSWARRAAKYDICLSLQPAIGAFIYEANSMAIGKKASRIYGLRELWDAGLSIAGGSDCPCSYPNWRQGVQAAVTRRSDVTGELHCPELAITVAEGIKLFTYNGAYQEHFERVRGSIEIGKVADLQVLEENIFQVAPDDIGKINVDFTMVGGKIVYTKE